SNSRAFSSSSRGSRGDRLRQASRAFSTAARDSSAGRQSTARRLGAPSFSRSGATLVTLPLFPSEVGVRKDLIGSVRSLGVGWSERFRNRFACFSWGTPTPSFQRLIELLADTEKAISRICKSV